MNNEFNINNKAFELIQKNKDSILKICTFKEFRSKVSSFSAGLIICNPKKYYDTLMSSSSQGKFIILIMNIFNELVKEDNRKDLQSFLLQKKPSKIQELKFKKDSQKYFTIIKNTLNLERF